MLKKFLFVCLVISGLIAGNAMAADFDAVYDKGPDCFMSLDYEGSQGLAPRMLITNKQFPEYGRNYIRNDGRLWRETGMGSVETIPVFLGNAVGPAWFCPEQVIAAVTPPPAEAKTFVVHFDFDKSVIKEDQVSILVEAVQYAQEHGYSVIELASFCDFRGSEEYNVGLSERRSTAVQHWMIENGIGTDGFDVEDNGKFKSLIKELVGRFCKTCWEDRRVEITVVP